MSASAPHLHREPVLAERGVSTPPGDRNGRWRPPPWNVESQLHADRVYSFGVGEVEFDGVEVASACPVAELRKILAYC